METIAVWFSCGAASATAAALTLEQYGGTHEVQVLNNPVLEEGDDNQRFLSDVEQWLGVRIETVTNHRYPACSAVEVWEKRQYMSGVAGAPCTVELKKQARVQWEMDHDIDWHVLGFTADERKRFENFRDNERNNTLPVLIDAGMTKADCYRYVQQAGLVLPEAYRLGYPNANCRGCVKATSPTYWNHVRRVDPGVFEERAEMSRRLGVRLARHKGVRVYLDELPADAVGKPMKNLDFECGVFCHTGEA